MLQVLNEQENVQYLRSVLLNVNWECVVYVSKIEVKNSQRRFPRKRFGDYREATLRICCWWQFRKSNLSAIFKSRHFTQGRNETHLSSPLHPFRILFLTPIIPTHPSSPPLACTQIPPPPVHVYTVTSPHVITWRPDQHMSIGLHGWVTQQGNYHSLTYLCLLAFYFITHGNEPEQNIKKIYQIMHKSHPHTHIAFKISLGIQNVHFE